MSEIISIHSPVASNDHDGLNFAIDGHPSVKKGLISRSALVKLDGVNGNELVQIFVNAKPRIHAAVSEKLKTGMHLFKVSIDSDDF